MRFLVKITETIRESAVDEIADPLPFHREETGYVLVADRVVNVDRAVANIEIPADDKTGTGLPELIDVCPEISHILEFVIQSLDVCS
jgi:hypothetical protein